MNDNLKVLVACEESGIVRDNFIDLGFENTFSCDLEPASGKYRNNHIQEDVTHLLKEKWDLIIAFPPCTYLTVTGNRWFDIEKYGEKAIQRHKDREEAIKFFMIFANADCPHVAIENPVGIMSSVWRKSDQIIHPYHFGDAFEKKTCLWLRGLPKLKHTNVVEPPERRAYESGRTMPVWYAQLWSLSPAERSRQRSKTFPGIASQMAIQWSKYILDNS